MQGLAIDAPPLTNLSKNFVFTLQKQTNCPLTFVTFTITNKNNNISINVYRQQTFAEIAIHNLPNNPVCHNLAAYKSIIKVRLC